MELDQRFHDATISAARHITDSPPSRTTSTCVEVESSIVHGTSGDPHSDARDDVTSGGDEGSADGEPDGSEEHGVAESEGDGSPVGVSVDVGGVGSQGSSDEVGNSDEDAERRCGAVPAHEAEDGTSNTSSAKSSPHATLTAPDHTRTTRVCHGRTNG